MKEIRDLQKKYNLTKNEVCSIIDIATKKRSFEKIAKNPSISEIIGIKKRIKNMEDWATFMDDTRFIHCEKEFKDFSQTGTPWRFEGAGYYYSTGELVTEKMEEDDE